MAKAAGAKTPKNPREFFDPLRLGINRPRPKDTKSAEEVKRGRTETKEFRDANEELLKRRKRLATRQSGRLSLFARGEAGQTNVQRPTKETIG